jgi:hypothetical protein
LAGTEGEGFADGGGNRHLCLHGAILLKKFMRSASAPKATGGPLTRQALNYVCIIYVGAQAKVKNIREKARFA